MDTQYVIFEIVMHVFMFVFGACIGSFLNVCIYRLPKEESLIKRNSHCMTCDAYIKRRDLIPIISWCVLRGKCRSCGAKISPRYTVVESLNAVGWVLISLQLDLVGNTLYTVLCCLVYSALIVVFFMDWDTQLISTGVVIFIGILAIPEYFFCTRSSGLDLKSHLIGMVIGCVPFLLIWLLSKGRAMGLGDVYLMTAAGLYLGTARIICALFLGIFIGAIAGLILKKIGGDSKFAFGPWLSLGILISMLWGYDIANVYLNFTGIGEIIYGEGFKANMPYEPIETYISMFKL